MAKPQTTKARRVIRHKRVRRKISGSTERPRLAVYRSLQHAERLMKLGVDESFVPGVRLEEREDDGSDEFDRVWKRLAESEWPIW